MFRYNVFNQSEFRRLSVLGFFAIVFLLSACDLARNNLKSDRGANMEIQDYRDGLAERLPEVDESSGGAAGDSSIPALQPYIASVPENLKPMPLVSISVNQSVPLRDILFELAQQADYDLELDPRIRGSIIFTARERPFDLVIKRISEIAGLRYSFADDVLRVELDTPYNKVYKIDYLSYIRKNTGSISNDISVVSGDGADTGSNYKAESESEADFWGELETNLEQILTGTSTGALKTESDPRITAVAQNPEVETVAPQGQGGEDVAYQPPQATLNVESLPIDDEGSSNNRSNNRSNNSREDDLYQQSFTINKQAGLLNVMATERGHKEVQEYLRILRRSVTAQVLIEAKILEVDLSDEHSTGIDWSVLPLFGGEFSNVFTGANSLLGTTISTANFPGAAPHPDASVLSGASNFAIGYAGNDVQAVIDAISAFGTVRALASPRLTVLNNQSAVLNVATNQVFFDIDIDITTQDATQSANVDSEIRNVPEGVLVNVQPSVNLEDGTISMAVRPTITRILQSESDPAVQFAVATLAAPPPTPIESLIPELNVQEIDSVIQVRSGQPVVMGGLLQDTARTNEEGVPVLSETPMVGNLFKDHQDLVHKTELVIFLKATILESPSDSIHNSDRDLYRMFSGDRRPFRL